MSWFSGNTVSVTELDSKITEATSESIPNGEIDISIALEITDLIKSRKIPPKQCMRSLKKRLINTFNNPNLLISTLKLIDLCVKNGGFQFLIEISSKEFIDYLIDYIFKIHYNTKNYQVYSIESKKFVGDYILKLLKQWSYYFKNQLQLNYVEKIYNQLLNQGFEFPELDQSLTNLNASFIDTDTPPDWIDNNECMICYSQFTTFLRKHHCRSCGQVFCQSHSSHSIPLVNLGIMEPVRVCDNCYEKVKLKNSNNLDKVKVDDQNNTRKHTSNNDSNVVDDEDEQLRKAIELSLKDTGVQTDYNAPPAEPPASISHTNEDDIEAASNDEDDEMKAAIAASLKEFNNNKNINEQQNGNIYEQQQMNKQQSNNDNPQANQSDLYSNILPFDENQSSFQNTFQQSPPQKTTQQFQQSPFQNPSQQSQQVHQSQQFQQAPQLPQQTKQIEDLTQQEEDSIDLFITLMNQTKNDLSKQTNIIYDSNLSELHNKVIQLKPKLNKSLRISIERYDHFLELNNKISTITRLYDSFLESKLNQAYNNHHISHYPPIQQINQSSNQLESQFTGNNVPSQFTGNNIASQFTGNYMPPQFTGSHVPPQLTGNNVPSQFTGNNVPPQFTNSENHIPYPIEESGSQKSPSISSPPIASPQVSSPIQSQSQQPYPNFPPNAYSNDNSNQVIDNTTGPSYPPGDSDEDESEAESVASRFPPIEQSQEDQFADNAELSNIPPPANAQSVNVRYPSMRTIENNNNNDTALSQLPNMPSLPLVESINQSNPKSKLRAEPEPLIEL